MYQETQRYWPFYLFMVVMVCILAVVVSIVVVDKMNEPNRTCLASHEEEYHIPMRTTHVWTGKSSIVIVHPAINGTKDVCDVWSEPTP